MERVIHVFLNVPLVRIDYLKLLLIYFPYIYIKYRSFLLGISKSDVVFTENVKYKYEFRGQTTIITPTDTKDGMSKMSIKGMVYIIGMPSCGAILYLKNVEIKQGSKVVLLLWFFITFVHVKKKYFYKLLHAFIFFAL